MKNTVMGLIYADIEIVNPSDLEFVRRGYMDIEEVRKMHINILVDTGSYMLAINENMAPGTGVNPDSPDMATTKLKQLATV